MQSPYRQTEVRLTNLAGGAGLPVIQDGGEWVFVEWNDQALLSLKFDQDAPFNVRNRILIQRPFQQLIISNPNNTQINDAAVLYGSGPPPNIPSQKDQVYDYGSGGDLVIAAGATANIASPYGPVRYIDLCIPTGQPGGLRIGVNAGVAAGVFLPVGQVLRIPLGASAVLAYNPNAAPVTLTQSTIVEL